MLSQERAGQLWGPEGAITAARITFNRHTGTTERPGRDAPGEHTTALATAPATWTFTSLLTAARLEEVSEGGKVRLGPSRIAVPFVASWPGTPGKK